jgi:hypothetical protein
VAFARNQRMHQRRVLGLAQRVHPHRALAVGIVARRWPIALLIVASASLC